MWTHLVFFIIEVALALFVGWFMVCEPATWLWRAYRRARAKRLIARILADIGPRPPAPDDLWLGRPQRYQTVHPGPRLARVSRLRARNGGLDRDDNKAS